MTEAERVRAIIAWIDRMAAAHGGIVRGHDGRRWDWGQALCVEQYGTIRNSLGYLMWPESPSAADVDRAKRWEAGEWPEWVDREGEP